MGLNSHVTLMKKIYLFTKNNKFASHSDYGNNI